MFYCLGVLVGVVRAGGDFLIGRIGSHRWLCGVW